MTYFEAALERMPLIAILRGVRPEEAVDIGAALIEAGINVIEVPLNSPEPFESIARLSEAFESVAVIGAGTVLRIDQVERLSDAGGTIAVSPNMNPAVIEACLAKGIVSIPGIATSTEAFAAIEAGAAALKLFPAEGSSPAWLRALRAVLPAGVPVLPVGGIQPDIMDAWLRAGARGFGLGSGLFQPGLGADEVGARAAKYVEVMKMLSIAGK
jgi:2-dehydro-3-deoxyphosphogalactonate aldolase